MASAERSQIWVQVLEEYKRKLSAQDLKAVHAVKDIETLTSNLAERLFIPDSDPNRVDRLGAMEVGLQKYGRLLAVFSSTIPEISGIIWGSIDLISEVRKTSSCRKFDSIADRHVSSDQSSPKTCNN